MNIYPIIAILLISISTTIQAGGNTTNQSFSKAKKMLMRNVYTEPSQRYTIYCGAEFDEKKTLHYPLALKLISTQREVNELK
tara:strand:- start:753 stop:998 length:246 start_codon:yes stop_codon:yes gene_type:complete